IFESAVRRFTECCFGGRSGPLASQRLSRQELGQRAPFGSGPEGTLHHHTSGFEGQQNPLRGHLPEQIASGHARAPGIMAGCAIFRVNRRPVLGLQFENYRDEETAEQNSSRHDPGENYFAASLTAWPPNCCRMAASMRDENELSWRERKRICSDRAMTGAGTESRMDSSTVQRPSPLSSTKGASLASDGSASS